MSNEAVLSAMNQDVVLGFILGADGKRVGMRVLNRQTKAVTSKELPTADIKYWNLDYHNGRLIPKCCNLGDFPLLSTDCFWSPMSQNASFTSKNAGAWLLDEYPDGRLSLVSVAGQVKTVTMTTALDFHNQYKIANAVVSEGRLIVKTSTIARQEVKPVKTSTIARQEVKPVKSSTTVKPEVKSSDTYNIYQLKDGDINRYRRFISLELLAKQGEKPDIKNYAKVYDGILYAGDTLDSLYSRFNTTRPADFRGHSLSMSDIVVLHKNGVATAYYVDTLGFQECSDFLSAAKSSLSGPCVLATYNNWSGGLYWDRMETVTDKFDFCCTLVDLSTLVEKRYTRAELEGFLSTNPNLVIPNITHAKGVLKNIFALHHPHCVISGEYALITNARTDRGNFAICKLYKKGVGLIHKFETPHYTRFYWSFQMSASAAGITITAMLEKYGDGSEEAYTYLLKDSGKGITVLKAPTQQDVDRGTRHVHSCSSCDDVVPLKECDGFGRCARCQEEYGDID